MSVNKENVLALRDFIASEEFGFDMDRGLARPSCGTAGCIGGHAAILWPEVRASVGTLSDAFAWYETDLAEMLGVTLNTEHQLCYPSWHRTAGFTLDAYPDHWRSVSRADAVRVLTKLAETGEVDWSKP